MISKSVSDQRDPLKLQAASLVQVCSIQAISSNVPLIKRFQFLTQCNQADWDFFFIVAGVHVALDDLYARIAPERFVRLVKIVEGILNEKHPSSSSALGDCEVFVGRTLDKLKPANRTEITQWAVGMWVLTNVLRRTPTQEEARMAAYPIGSMLAHALADWWEPEI